MIKQKTNNFFFNTKGIKLAMCDTDKFTRRQRPNPADKGKQPYEDDDINSTQTIP
ncbi:hypothetical protein [Histophilus somni]|uniref:hypothetical protein n=1 Tax=Histophilus somni TaxID=731 RepID=UPI0002FAA702|nr:hypothetical protein [Histophilus somni]